MRFFLLLHLVVITQTKEPKTKTKFIPPAPKINRDNDNDQNMYDNTIPIDFLNMGIEGVYDPSFGRKQPFDGLAMYLVHERKTNEDLRALLNQIAEASNLKPKYGKTTITKDSMSKLPDMFDFEAIHSLNLARPNIYKEKISKGKLLFKTGNRGEDRPRPEGPRKLEEIIPLSAFDMRSDVNEDVDRWTSCDDFGNKARFHPRDVAGVTWVPFYLWSMQTYPIPEEFKFSYPTIKLVQDYKDQYASKLPSKIDWSAPMLLLRNWLEMLLVGADRRGLFYGIPKAAIPSDIGNSTTWYPHVTIRMKMVDHYLAMMFCEEHLALMLAVAGEAPDPSESAAEAAKLGFRGIGAPVTKQGLVAPAKDDRLEEIGDRTLMDRHSAVVKSFFNP